MNDERGAARVNDVKFMNGRARINHGGGFTDLCSQAHDVGAERKAAEHSAASDGKRFGNFTHFKDGVDDAQKVRGFSGACVVFTFAAAGTPAIGSYDEPAARNQSLGHGGDDFVIFAAALRGDRMRQKGDALGADIGKIDVEFDKAGFTGGLCSMRSGHFSKAVHFLI